MGHAWTQKQRSHNLGNFPQIFAVSMGGGIRHNEDIMHSFQNFIVPLIPNHPSSPSRNKDMEISCESAAQKWG